MLSEDARKLIFLSPVPTCNSQVCFGSSVAMNERTQRSFLTASGFLIRWRNTRFQIVSVFPRWRQNCSKASNEAFLLLNSQFSAPCTGLEKCQIPVVAFLWFYKLVNSAPPPLQSLIVKQCRDFPLPSGKESNLSSCIPPHIFLWLTRGSTRLWSRWHLHKGHQGAIGRESGLSV